jgi:hypothetical protein
VENLPLDIIGKFSEKMPISPIFSHLRGRKGGGDLGLVAAQPRCIAILQSL